MASILLFLLLAFFAQGQIGFLSNCEIANLSNSSCVTCKSGYSLVGNQCLAIVLPQTNIFGSNQLTLSNLFSNIPNQNQQGSSLIYTNNNFVPSASSSNNQVFIPGYLQPGASSNTNLNLGTNANSGNSQIQNAYLQSLLSYLASQNNGQGQTTQATASALTNGNSQNKDPNCKTKSNVSDACVECYQSFYYNTSIGKCLTVNPLCRNYTQQNQCTACFEGYALSNGNCIVSPTYKAPQSGDQNCKIKTQSNPPGCFQCYPSFYFNSTEGKCLQANPLCKTVTNLNKCTSCYSGYTLDVVQGNCFISNSSSNISPTTSSGSATNNNDQNAAILAILSQYFGNAATSSSTGNYVRQVGNYQVVFNAQGQVISVYQISNANQASTTTQGVALDPQCTHYVSNLCQGCNFGYYLSPQGCISIDPNCVLWNSSICAQCALGYQLANGRCSLPSAATVFRPSSSTSSQNPCFFRQVFLNGACVQVNDNCRTWDERAQCSSCYGGYILGGGQCSVASAGAK